MAKAERVVLPNNKGKVDIAETPEKFPLGARGQRPFRFTLEDDDDIAKLKELDIPGVLVRGRRVDCAYDVAPEICNYIGCPGALNAPIQLRENCPIPMPGLPKYKALGLDKKRRDYQGHSTRFLFRRAYGYLTEEPRMGKCIIVLCVFILDDAKKMLILCNSLGKYVWGEEIAKWIGEEAVLLFGRAGHEVRVFCKACQGAGEVVRADGAVDEFGAELTDPCKVCRVRGVSRGERIHLVRELEAETQSWELQDAPTEEQWEKHRAKDAKRLAEWETKDPKRRKPFKPSDPPNGKKHKVRFCTVPSTFRCPKHTDEADTKPRPCRQCKAELFTVLEKAPIIVSNYDIIYSQLDKNDVGVEYAREDLPGWGPILARFKFDMALLSEAHRLRGYELQAEKRGQTRRDRADALCDPIERVMAETGTPLYGFVRDYFSVLDIISKGLFS